jgi:hypothetical protein
VSLGLEFIASSQDTDKTEAREDSSSASDAVQQVSTDSKPLRARQNARQQLRRNRPGERKREPLKPWQEYAHALMQANETSFVN